MKMKMSVMIASLLLAFSVCAKDVPTPPPTASIALPFDGQAKTNRAALASLAILNVDNIVVEIDSGANADLGNNYNEPERIIIPYPYAVKSLDDMMSKVMERMYQFQVVDTTKKVWVSIRFCKGDVSDRYSGYGDNARFQTLFFGQNEDGNLEEWKGGSYTLSNGHIKMRLNSEIRFRDPGIVAGKAIHENGGGSWSSPLRVYRNGEFDLPVDVVGSGKIVKQGYFGNGFQTIAESLVGGTRIPIDDVIIRVMLSSDPEVLRFNSPSGLDIMIQSYNGRAVNPLLVVKMNLACPPGYVCTPAPIPLTLSTTEGIRARSFRVINITDRTEVTYAVPPLAPLKVPLSNNAEYHIIPDLPVVGGNNGGVVVGGEKG